MNEPQLSPRERERLERYMRNVTKLARKELLSENNAFIMRQQIRAILKMLGAGSIDRVFAYKALEIMADPWPFKERRLRKLVDVRRPK